MSHVITATIVEGLIDVIEILIDAPAFSNSPDLTEDDIRAIEQAKSIVVAARAFYPETEVPTHQTPQGLTRILNFIEGSIANAGKSGIEDRFLRQSFKEAQGNDAVLDFMIDRLIRNKRIKKLGKARVYVANK